MENQTLPLNYQSLKADKKLSLLWDQKIVPTTYTVLPPIKFVSIFWKFFKLLSPSYLAVTFNLVSDEFPKNRERLIHPNGVVAKVEWIADPDVQMSGIFKTGAMGLVRLSLAGNPHAARSYVPGMGLKLFVDAHPSVNLQVMHKLTGQGENQNFFQEDFSNIIPDPPFFLWLFAKAFATAKNPPTVLNVDHLSLIQRDGTIVSTENVIPVYQIVMMPNHALDINPQTVNDFREELATIKENSVLYTLYIRQIQNGDLIKIGTLITRSAFISSAYGDERLFFQHYRR